MKKIIIFIFFIFSFFKINCEVINKIIVRVNNEVITSKDLEDYCNLLIYRFKEEVPEASQDEKKIRKEALDKLIDDKLILDKARKENIQVPPQWIENKLREIISSYKSVEEFENSLVERGLTVSTLKERIKEQYIIFQTIEKYVRGKVEVSPKEINDYYNTHSEDFIVPERYLLLVFKTQDNKKLEEISSLIDTKGIQELVKENPKLFFKLESPISGLKDEMVNVVNTLSENSYKTLKMGDFFYLVYLEKKLPSFLQSFEEVREKIYNIIWSNKVKEKFQNWVNDLRKDATIIKFVED